MKITMTPTKEEPAGWALPLMDHGIKAVWRPFPSGRVEWVFRKDGEAIIVQQGTDTGIDCEIAKPTQMQQEIVRELVSAGIATIH